MTKNNFFNLNSYFHTTVFQDLIFKSKIRFYSSSTNSISKSQVLGLGPNSNLLKQYKDSLGNLLEIEKEAGVGLMLGDASLQTQNKGKTFRLKFEWSNKHKAYLDHVYSTLDRWVLSEPHAKLRISPLGNEVHNWGFQTISHEAFNYLAELFLDENFKKYITPDLIKNHLTPRGLSFWFCDDGGKLDYNKNSKNKSVVLNTHSFKDEEVSTMAQQLGDKFNLNVEIRSNKGKKIIVIKSDSYPTFLSLIDPYIIAEMRFKLP